MKTLELSLVIVLLTCIAANGQSQIPPLLARPKETPIISSATASDLAGEKSQTSVPIEELIAVLQKEWQASVGSSVEIRVDKSVFERKKGDVAHLEQAMRAMVSDLEKFANNADKKRMTTTTIKTIIFMQSQETDPRGGLYRTLELDYNGSLILYKDVDEGWSWVEKKSDEVRDRIGSLLVDRYPIMADKKKDEGKSLAEMAKERGISDTELEAMIKQYQGMSKRNFTGELGVFSRSEAEAMVRGSLTSLYH